MPQENRYVEYNYKRQRQKRENPEKPAAKQQFAFVFRDIPYILDKQNHCI
jgi:hypothetical protein